VRWLAPVALRLSHAAAGVEHPDRPQGRVVPVTPGGSVSSLRHHRLRVSHVGHARFLVAFRRGVRFLRWAGWKVTYVRNWTDVDDKIIRRAAERGQDPRQLAEAYIAACREDFQALSVLPADVERARRTTCRRCRSSSRAHRAQQRLRLRGRRLFLGPLLSAVRKLSKTEPGRLLAGARVERASGSGIHWTSHLESGQAGRAGQRDVGEPVGAGRPGWHIECRRCRRSTWAPPSTCTAGKGPGLSTPRERDRAERGASGQPLAHFWLHNGFVTIDAEKMSSRWGNFPYHPRPSSSTGTASRCAPSCSRHTTGTDQLQRTRAGGRRSARRVLLRVAGEGAAYSRRRSSRARRSR